MKREFLVGLGLEKEVIDKIMAVHGADMEQSKDTIAEYARKLGEANDKISTLEKASGDAGEIQKKLEDLQQKYDTDTQALQGQLNDRDYVDAISRSIAGANGGKGVKFSSKGAERAFRDALMKDRKEIKDGLLEGFDDYLTAQKDSDPGQFLPDKQMPKIIFPSGSGGAPAGESNGAKFAKQFSAQYESKKE